MTPILTLLTIWTPLGFDRVEGDRLTCKALFPSGQINRTGDDR
jgi:hypothetical protein